MLFIYLLNVLSIFAGISILIAFLHMFAAMKRCFGYGTMAGLPILVGQIWAFVNAGAEETLLTTIGSGLLIAFGIMFVLSFGGALILSSKITASEAENGYRGLGPLFVTSVGCAVYIALILGMNSQILGQPNFWSDAADLEKYGMHAEGGH